MSSLADKCKSSSAFTGKTKVDEFYFSPKKLEKNRAWHWQQNHCILNLFLMMCSLLQLLSNETIIKKLPY